LVCYCLRVAELGRNEYDVADDKDDSDAKQINFDLLLVHLPNSSVRHFLMVSSRIESGVLQAVLERVKGSRLINASSASLILILLELDGGLLFVAKCRDCALNNSTFILILVVLLRNVLTALVIITALSVDVILKVVFQHFSLHVLGPLGDKLSLVLELARLLSF